MTVAYRRDQAAVPLRRLPIRVANESRMIQATIDLLTAHEVDAITSRMIAERSDTATNYITRYFGGRDGLLAVTAQELGAQIAAQIESPDAGSGLDDPLEFLQWVVDLPEVDLWFKLFRYLAAHNLTVAGPPGTKPPLTIACEAAVARVFRLEGEDVQFWSNVFLTYMMGGVAFGPLLGTTPEEGKRTLGKLGALVALMRDGRITLEG
jgi:AcrR family transcriptional regulator